MQLWTVQYRPVTHEDVRGLGVFITDGDDEREVGRVAFVRTHAKDPNATFEDQLAAVTVKADAAADLINETMDEVARLNDTAELERRERERAAIEGLAAKLREAVGSVPRPRSFV